MLAVVLLCGVLTSCKKDDDTPFLSVSDYFVSFDATGGSRIINISSNTEWEINCENNNEKWLSINPTSGKGKQEVELKASANTSSQKLSSILNIRTKDGGLSQRVDVSMNALNISLSVSSSNLSFEPIKGDEKHFTIICNADWRIENIPDWLDVNPAAGSESRTTSVTLKTIKSNDSSVPLSATLRVVSGDKTENVIVSQDCSMATECFAVPVDMVSMCESVVWSFEWGKNVHKVIFDIRKSSVFDLMNHDDIINDIKDNGYQWTTRTPEQFRLNGNCFSLYGCTPNTEYTLVSVCYDEKGKLGEIIKTPIKTKKDDLYTSPYIKSSSVIGNYDLDDNNSIIYKISAYTDATSSYASSFYTWGIVGTILFESIDPLQTTDAIIAWFLNKEIMNNPAPHDTYYNGKDRDVIRERLEGPSTTFCEMILPANVANDKYMQTINWCKNLNGEFSGKITNISWNLSENESSANKMVKRSAVEIQNKKETLVQFDSKKLFDGVKVICIK